MPVVEVVLPNPVDLYELQETVGVDAFSSTASEPSENMLATNHVGLRNHEDADKVIAHYGGTKRLLDDQEFPEEVARRHWKK